MLLLKIKNQTAFWRRAVTRWIWLRRKGPARRSRGIFIFGAQRSGTTMLADCFENSPEFDVYGEMSVAFENSVLKSPDTARQLIEASRRPFVAFKPLTDSHRVASLLSVSDGAKAIWMYRRPHDRANSAVAKFGDTNLRFLRELMVDGHMDRWESRGLTPDTMSTLRRFDWAVMDAHAAAGAFWYLRNQLFFDQRLDNNRDVLLVKYEAFVTRPEQTMRFICDFAGCEFQPQMIRNIHSSSVGRSAGCLPREIEDLCNLMLNKLDEAFMHQSEHRNAALSVAH